MAYKEIIEILSGKKEDVIDITPKVKDIVKKSDISEGLCLVFPMHTTSAVFINDSDFNVTDDVMNVLKKLVPDGDYKHVDSKNNAEGHIKSTLVGHHVTLPVSDGKLDLGQYQTIYYAEFDGMRKKEILVKVIGE